MNENENVETPKTKLDTAKNAAETVVLIASAVIAAKGLWDLGAGMTEEIKNRRARKKEAKNEE